jgi:hypothetical protein
MFIQNPLFLIAAWPAKQVAAAFLNPMTNERKYRQTSFKDNQKS